MAESGPDAMKRWLLNLVDWIIPFGLVLGFFWLQVQLQAIESRWLRDTVLVLSVVAEVRLIWLWERWAVHRVHG